MRRKIAAIVVNVNGVTAYQLNEDGTYGQNILPFDQVRSAREAAQRLHDDGFGLGFRLDACLAGTRVSSMIRVGEGRWQESDFVALGNFPRYPGEVFHTGLHDRRLALA